MKFIGCLVFSSFLFVYSASAKPSGPVHSLPIISVSGTATIQATPDILRWALTITNKGRTPTEVADEHTRITAEVIRFLKEKQIKPDEIQSSNMSLFENGEWKNSSWIRDGYRATTDVSFVSDNLSLYRELWHGLAQINGVRIDSATWDTTKRIELQNKTRKHALEAARTKARDMAAVLDARIGAATSIREELIRSSSTSGPTGNFVGQDDDSDDGEHEFIAPGAIPIMIRVHVSFELID